MFDYTQIRNLIILTLQELKLKSKSATNLLLGTMAQESLLGTYLFQIRGTAMGIFQMEPATHDDIWERYLSLDKKRSLKDRVLTVSNLIDERDNDLIPEPYTLVYNLKYAICMARVHYLRFPEQLPKHDDIEGMARYHKKYYNTYKGKSTIRDFIWNYKNFCT